MADRMRLDATMLHHLAVWKAMVSVHRQNCTFNQTNLLPYLANWPLYTLENGFWGFIERQGGPFLGFAQASSASIVRTNLPKQAPTKARQRVLLITQLYMCMGVHLQCAYAQLSPLYLLSILYVYPTLLCDKLFQVIYCFSVLQAMESWAGPWNKALQTPLSRSILLY